MAANDYYNNTTGTAPTTSYSSPTTHHNPYDRTDAPLPPVPGPNHSTQSISPVSSPFDDNHRFDYTSTHNLTQSQTHTPHSPMTSYGDTGYHGASPYNNNRPYDSTSHHDPFADQNAIPLRQQGKLNESPTGYDNDPERRMYADGYGQEKKKKKGWFSGRVTWICYIFTIVQCGVFVGELIKNGVLTGTPIAIKPRFNIMIGPSPYVLINMGARYPPCMHNILHVTDNADPVLWPCPNSTTDEIKDNSCTLTQLCGFGGNGVPEQTYPTKFTDRSKEPDQWWRFIVPIFLHAGLIHLGFNMLLQMTLGRDMEKEIGPLRFFIVYISSGIFGFVLGGNYAAENIPSVGASGSLFGVLALVLLDLLYNWSSRRSPVKDLLFLLLDFAIAFVLGLLPGLDNFSHIGGFLMGLVLGICLLRSPAALRERVGVDEPPYATVNTAATDGQPAMTKFVKQPLGFFKGRKPFWWAWWLIRAGALVAVFVGFILLLRNFYEWRNTCSWCYRLTCLPIKDWCDIGNINIKQIQENTNENPAKMARDMLMGLK